MSDRASVAPRKPGMGAEAVAPLLPIMAVVLVAFLVIGIALPVLPLHVHDGLGLGTFTVGLVAGSQFVASLLSRVWAGDYADRRGPKRGIVLGLLGAAASGALYVLSLALVDSPIASVMILILGRALLGAAESLIITSAVSWGLVLAGPRNSGRAIGWIGMAMFAGLAGGAPIGSALYAIEGFGTVAMATTLVPFGALLLVARLPNRTANPPRQRVPFLEVAKALWLPGIGAALSSLGFGAILSFSALLFAERGWGLLWLPFTAYAVGLISARALLGHLPDAYGGAKVAALSVVVEAVGLLVIWMATGPATGAIGAALTGLGYSLVFPGLGLEAVNRTPATIRGLVMGVYTAFLDIALGLGLPALGLVAQWSSVGTVFLASAAIVSCALFMTARLLSVQPPS